MGCDLGFVRGASGVGNVGLGYMYAGWRGQAWGERSLQLVAVGKGRDRRESDDCVTPASQPGSTPRVIACV